MKEQIAAQLEPILAAYDPTSPAETADTLREIWLGFEPKGLGIKAELQEKQETIGIPVPVLKTIGKGLSKTARKRVDDFIPLTRLLWDEYGREGRVVGLLPLGAMELVDPHKIVPMLEEMTRSCVTWEDADRMAMDALEPIVRKKPDEWLSVIEPWLVDENKWVRRVAAIVIGRLPIKHPAYTERCVDLLEGLLFDEEVEVKKGVSFAIRLCCRGAVPPVREFLERHVPPKEAVATWVLCDVIRSMTPSFLPEFKSLLLRYEKWAADSSLNAKDRRSVESAVKKLRSVTQ